MSMSGRAPGGQNVVERVILEQINGSTTNMATLHFLNPTFDGHDQRSSVQVSFNRADFQTWALKVDRTPANIRDEKLTWYVDGNPFFEFTPGALGNADGGVQWEDVADREFFSDLECRRGWGLSGAAEWSDGGWIGDWNGG